MKKKIQYLMIVFFTLILMIGGTACMENPNDYSTSDSQSSEANSSTEVITKSDRQIVEGVWNERQGTDSVWEGEGFDYIGEVMKYAEVLSGKLFESINSEEDAKEKGRAAIMEIERSSESEMEYYKRPFEARFYEKYGAWMVNGTPPPGYTDEQGREIPPPPASVSYVIIRESDGKVLAYGIL